MGSPNSQVSHIGMILATINVNSTVARRVTNSATKDELKGKQVKHPKVWMVRIAKDECVNFHRQMKIDANTDTDLTAFISCAAFGGDVSIADDQQSISEVILATFVQWLMKIGSFLDVDLTGIYNTLDSYQIRSGALQVALTPATHSTAKEVLS